jgi:hypothetical protein
MKTIERTIKVFLAVGLFLFACYAQSQTYEVYDQQMRLKSRIEFDRICILGESVRVSTANDQLRLLSKEYRPFLDLKANSVFRYDQPWLIVEGPNGKGVFHEYGEEILTAGYDQIQTLYTQILSRKGDSFWLYEHSSRKNSPLGKFDDAVLAKNGQVIARIGTAYFLPLSPFPDRPREMIQEVNSDFLFVKEQSGYGLVNRAGEYILDPIIDQMAHLDDVYFYAFDGSQYMLIEAKEIRAQINYTSFHKITLEGNMMLEYIHGKLRRVMQHEGILLDQVGMETVTPVGEKHYNVSLRDKTMGLLGPKGWEVNPTPGLQAIFPGKDGLFPAKKDGNYGFVDGQGNWTISPGFEEVRPFAQGLAAVKKDGLWGFIDKTGSLAIDPKFDFVSDFKRNITIVKSRGKYQLLDRAGAKLLPNDYDRVSLAADDYFITEQDKKFGLVAPDGKEIVEPKFEELRREELDRILVRLGDKYGILNENGEYILPVYYKSIVFDSGALQILAEDQYQFGSTAAPRAAESKGKRKKGV